MSTHARVFIVSSRRRSHKVIKRRSPSVPQPEQRHRRAPRVPRLGLRRRDSRRWRPPRRARGHPPLPPEPTRARAEKREGVRRGRLFRRTAVFEILLLYEGRSFPSSKEMALLTLEDGRATADFAAAASANERARCASASARYASVSSAISASTAANSSSARSARSRSFWRVPARVARVFFFFCVSTVLSLPVSVSSPQSPPRTTARRSRPRPRPRARRRPFAPRSAVFQNRHSKPNRLCASSSPRSAPRAARPPGRRRGPPERRRRLRTLSPRPRRARPAPRATPWARVRGPFGPRSVCVSSPC